MDMKPSKLPMHAVNNHIKALDTILCPTTAEAEHLALETSYFRYQGAIGELIWAMITCCPEISFPVIKLSQFSTHPAALHYQAVKRVFKYLAGTLDPHGLTYWRPSSHPDLPCIFPPSRLANPADQHLHHHDVSDASERYSPFFCFWLC